MAFTKIAAAGIGSTETVTLHSLEVLNNATVGGVLTYEDVTNVDSIGIVTARAGVLVGSGITLSKDGDIFATGVTTATSFVGDGSQLTGVASTDNIRTNTNATFLQNINVSGSTTTGSLVSSGDVSVQGNTTLGNATSDTISFTGRVNSDLTPTGTTRDLGTTGNEWRSLYTSNGMIADDSIATHADDSNTRIRFPENDTISMETNGSERLRITSGGYVRIGSNEGNYKTVIAEETSNTTTASTQLLLYAKHDGSGNTGVGFGGGIRFWGDRNGDNDVQNMGRIMCIADVNSGTTLSGALVFETASAGVNSAKLRITSAGSVGINQNDPQALLSLGAGVNAQKLLVYDNADNNKYGFGIQPNEFRQYYPSNSRLVIGTIDTSDGSTFSEKLRISSEGYVTKTNHPSFHANGAASPENSAGGLNDNLSQYMTVTLINEGSHFKTSGGDVGKFVVPVDGNYFFWGQALLRQIGNGIGSGELTFYKNNSNVSARALGYTYVTEGSSGGQDHDNLHVSCIISCSAGDKVHLQSLDTSSTVDWYWGQGIGNFGGFLIS